jgi:hypothetical protein
MFIPTAKRIGLTFYFVLKRNIWWHQLRAGSSIDSPPDLPMRRFLGAKSLLSGEIQRINKPSDRSWWTRKPEVEPSHFRKMARERAVKSKAKEAAMSYKEPIPSGRKAHGPADECQLIAKQ